jgi:hypothetical protein
LTRTKVLVAVGLVTAVIVTVCIVLAISNRPTDCDTVGSMIDHEQFRAAPATDENSAAPQWAKDFSRFGQQFNTSLATLDKRCPA